MRPSRDTVDLQFLSKVWWRSCWLCCSGWKQLSGGETHTAVGVERKGAASYEGRSRRTQVTAAAELCTTKQGTRTSFFYYVPPILNSVSLLLLNVTFLLSYMTYLVLSSTAWPVGTVSYSWRFWKNATKSAHILLSLPLLSLPVNCCSLHLGTKRSH